MPRRTSPALPGSGHDPGPGPGPDPGQARPRLAKALARALAGALAALAPLLIPPAEASGAFDGRPLVESLDQGRMCDRLAAFAADPRSAEASVDNAFFDPGRARRACMQAVSLDPDEPRYLFQLARAHWRLGDADTAYALLESAADAGYPGAWFILGRLFHHGEHVERNHTIALLHYLEAYRRGAPSGLVAAQAIYADPESPAHDPARAARAGDHGATLSARVRAASDW
ncbi:MAG: hypothetical protein AAGI51_05485 [Pseudomonadota bacterium]